MRLASRQRVQCVANFDPPSPFPPNSGGSNTSNSTFAAERADGRTRHETSERSLAIQISFRSVFPRLRHAFFTKQNVPTATMYAQAQTLHNNVACAPCVLSSLSLSLSLSLYPFLSPLSHCILTGRRSCEPNGKCMERYAFSISEVDQESRRPLVPHPVRGAVSLQLPVALPPPPIHAT